MHVRLLTICFLMADWLAASVGAQEPYKGTLGIFDDASHSQSFGTMAPVEFKTIYVGVDLDFDHPVFATRGSAPSGAPS